MTAFKLIAAAALAAALSACGPTISLPVSVKTSKGEMFRGMAQGPAFSGTVVLSSDKGARCEGPYTTSQDRVISATAQCNDGRTATLRATLEADLVSARGTAELSDGTTAQVGVGKHAQAVETGKPAAPAASAVAPASLSGGERATILEAVKSSLKDPYSAVISSVSAKKNTTGSVIEVCGLINAKNSYGAYVGNRPFYALAIKVGGAISVSPGVLTIANEPYELEFVRQKCAA